MRNILFAAVALAGLIGATAAMADDFSGPPPTSAAAAMNQQAAASQLADPTAPDSLRTHGHP